ncbi:electron transport complex subunit RsxB [Pantoea sp. 18069]|uniref:electron transport complex subunit RsxB n=1 Tax=Pantoea sp. 18069 TaxID=2681415 RepID=UPI00135CDD71|nr:electron transport complex subunit RsxB [Pantoea sp. 18069]
MPASALQGLAARIDAALPQTQCTRCGYPDCAAYAQAIADDAAAINQCPPGGAEGIARLAALTGRPVLPLSAEHGIESVRTLAVIDEAWCIGCTLCIKACPTDAIVGANKRMHTVIAPHCTGCELCIPVCPVDCITLVPASGGATGWAAWSQEQATHALSRYTRRQRRLGGSERAAAPKAAMAAGLEVALAVTAEPAAAADPVDAKKAAIAAAMARARAQRAGT